MNKILAAASVVLLVTSIVLGYQLYELRPRENTCLTLKYDYTNKPWTGQIDAKLAKVMADNYKADIQKSLISINNTITSDSDARSVWFPLESIKSYIWDIERQSCLNACDPENLGLRIYFAKYPESSSPYWTWPGLWKVKNEYANHHTIFMIPTYRNGGNDIDFDPWKGCGKLLPPGTIVNPLDNANSNKDKYVFYYVRSETGGDGKNHGGLIPPGNPSGTSF